MCQKSCFWPQNNAAIHESNANYRFYQMQQLNSLLEQSPSPKNYRLFIVSNVPAYKKRRWNNCHPLFESLVSTLRLRCHTWTLPKKWKHNGYQEGKRKDSKENIIARVQLPWIPVRSFSSSGFSNRRIGDLSCNASKRVCWSAPIKTSPAILCFSKRGTSSAPWPMLSALNYTCIPMLGTSDPTQTIIKISTKIAQLSS